LLTTEPLNKRPLMKKFLLFLMACACFARMQAQGDSAAIALSSASLSFFQALPVDNVILLKWSTGQTEEYKSFDVERSDDGVNFIKIGSKLAISKTGNAGYDFVDATPKRNVVLRYRLKAISRDGFVSYSELREAKTADPPLAVRLKQNPVRNNIALTVNTFSSKEVSIAVVSQGGQQMASQAFRLSAGANQLSVSSQSLTPGLYQLVVEAGTERKVISFIKE
jgi:hypothetical protein